MAQEAATFFCLGGTVMSGCLFIPAKVFILSSFQPAADIFTGKVISLDFGKAEQMFKDNKATVMTYHRDVNL